MGTSTRSSSADDAPSLAMSRQHEHHESAEHDLGHILRDIRDILAAARADIAEILRYSRPPNDHA
jgi:hypothetical protein